ncbi:MAG: nucleoside/nucleotide kinase family protein [Acidobacteria bacterium]|nr:nucleoside/nucleotide kinase family protein [Acidobacteriota bacterium]
MEFDDALGRLLGMLERGERVLLGIAGAPGAGKTTLAERLVAEVEASGRYSAAHVPMDGFHLADVALERLGRRDRKGAIDTFDGWGYRSLLQRLRDRPDEPVYAPGFERVIEQPLAASIAVGPEVDLIVSEGNYLLVDEAPWSDAAALLDEVWFADAPASLLRSRLIARHTTFGKTPSAAAAWVDAVDLPNAALIDPTRARADAVVRTS